MEAAILMGFFFINHPFWGTPIYVECYIYIYICMSHLSICSKSHPSPPRVLQVPLESQDARGRTAMHYAAASGDRENVQWLISQGPVVDL